MGTCAWGRAGSAVEHVGSGTAVALVVACWFFFSSHASLLLWFRSCLDLLMCFFFAFVDDVTTFSFTLCTGVRHVKVRYSEPPRVSRTNLAHVPLSKQCRYNSCTRVWVVLGLVAGQVAGSMAVIVCKFGRRPVEATPSPLPFEGWGG